MSKLSEMPVVTVDQIVRFREDALKVEKERDELLAAAQAVVAHRVGQLPTRGWLHDNDLSREAIDELCTAVAKAVQP